MDLHIFYQWNVVACSKHEYSAPKDNQLDEKMSASSFVEGSEPGLVGISGWEAKGASKDEWIEYDTSDNPRIAVESRTLIHKYFKYYILVYVLLIIL